MLNTLSGREIKDKILAAPIVFPIPVIETFRALCLNKQTVNQKKLRSISIDPV